MNERKSQFGNILVILGIGLSVFTLIKFNDAFLNFNTSDGWASVFQHPVQNGVLFPLIIYPVVACLLGVGAFVNFLADEYGQSWILAISPLHSSSAEPDGAKLRVRSAIFCLFIVLPILFTLVDGFEIMRDMKLGLPFFITHDNALFFIALDLAFVTSAMWFSFFWGYTLAIISRLTPTETDLGLNLGGVLVLGTLIFMVYLFGTSLFIYAPLFERAPVDWLARPHHYHRCPQMDQFNRKGMRGRPSTNFFFVGPRMNCDELLGLYKTNQFDELKLEKILEEARH